MGFVYLFVILINEFLKNLYVCGSLLGEVFCLGPNLRIIWIEDEVLTSHIDLYFIYLIMYKTQGLLNFDSLVLARRNYKLHCSLCKKMVLIR